MQGKTPTVAEDAWLDTVSQVGCIVCIAYCDRACDFGEGHCEIHHIDGSRSPGAHLKTIGLCSRHHRIADTNKVRRWISLHGDGRKLFEDTYARQADLLEEQKRYNHILRGSVV